MPYDIRKAKMRDVGEALDLLYHMLSVVSEGRQISREDASLLRDLINQIKNSN